MTPTIEAGTCSRPKSTASCASWSTSRNEYPEATMSPKRPKSHEAFARACKVIPGGVNSPARAFGGVGGEPIFIARGQGPYLYDVDGNQYLDYVGSWGPLILGHAPPRVVQAVEETMRRGASFGAPTELETELAELII